MAKVKVTADSLSDAIADIISDYADEIGENLQEITEKIGKKGAEALKNESMQKFGTTGGNKYAKGWKATTQKQRLEKKAIIYNQNVPGLPHLLEHGHAKRGGGRTAGVPHISTVESKLIEEFEREVESRL